MKNYLIDNLFPKGFTEKENGLGAYEIFWDFKQHLLVQEAVMNYNVEICMKVNGERWIKKLRNGEACFQPIDYFIKKAENDGNNEQGDKYEGIFGRLKKSDHRLTELKELLGDDLEIIDDEDYVILRRFSARNIPIFCMYGILRDDIKLDQSSVHLVDGEYIGKAQYKFPSKIYNGFLDHDDVWGFYCSAGHLHKELDKSLEDKKIKYKKAKISYDIDLTKEFLLKLNDTYSEVTHKRTDLSYQHEIRYYLLNFPRADKFILKYTPLSEHSCGIASKELYMEINCNCYPLEG